MKYLKCCQQHQKYSEKANTCQSSLVIFLLKVILQEEQNQSEKPVPVPRELKAAVPPILKPRSSLNQPHLYHS